MNWCILPVLAVLLVGVTRSDAKKFGDTCKTNDDCDIAKKIVCRTFDGCGETGMCMCDPHTTRQDGDKCVDLPDSRSEAGVSCKASWECEAGLMCARCPGSTDTAKCLSAAPRSLGGAMATVLVLIPLAFKLFH